MNDDEHGEARTTACTTAPAEIDRLEAAEPDRADHQRRRARARPPSRRRLREPVQRIRPREDRRGDDAGRRRASACRRSSACRRCADDWMLNRASRMAAAREVDEARRPADAAELRQSPGERQDGGRHAERDHVGERVELDAERARRVGQPRDAPVEHVEDERDADERRGGREVAAHRVHDAGVAAEHVADGEEARQQVDAAPVAARSLRRQPASNSVGHHDGPAAEPRDDGLAAAHLVSPC